LESTTAIMVIAD